VRTLRSPRAIRERAARVLDAGINGELAHFSVHIDRLPHAARLTAEVTRARYPELRIPAHSRFGHFDAGGVARNEKLARELATLSPIERARRLADLIVVSVLLDAGAGSAYRYVEPATGATLARSEALAIASLDWVRAGGLSSRNQPYAVDARGLCRVDEAGLARAFQVTEQNPLVGLSGRVQLMRALGSMLEARRDVFGQRARIGGLIDVLAQRADGGVLPAEEILTLVLDALGGIWPGRLTLEGAPLGDVWQHPKAGGEGATRGLMPFHKLSQWLSYSLLHPLEVAGVRVVELDALTGLAEYRNGGLFVDSGVIALKDKKASQVEHAVGSELIVEWRALTVALLDRIAPLVREALGLSAEALPLAAVLEGGTWAAGRKLASELRPGGDPPIRVASDGTVF
jgi:hypothetical protein